MMEQSYSDLIQKGSIMKVILFIFVVCAMFAGCGDNQKSVSEPEWNANELLIGTWKCSPTPDNFPESGYFFTFTSDTLYRYFKHEDTTGDSCNFYSVSVDWYVDNEILYEKRFGHYVLCKIDPYRYGSPTLYNNTTFEESPIIIHNYNSWSYWAGLSWETLERVNPAQDCPSFPIKDTDYVIVSIINDVELDTITVTGSATTVPIEGTIEGSSTPIIVWSTITSNSGGSTAGITIVTSQVPTDKDKIDIGASGDMQISVQVRSTACIGTYTLKISATVGGATNSAEQTIVVQGATDCIHTVSR